MSEDQLTPPVTARDHATGPENAPVTLVEYADYECPYCGMAYLIVKEAKRELGNELRFVFRNFPLAEAHPRARAAAQAAEAAAAQGRFWEMHDMLFEHQDALEAEDLLAYAKSIGLDMQQFARDLADPAYTKRVRDDFRSGVTSGVNGTPTFFMNGARYDGSWANKAAFINWLRDAIRPVVSTVEAPG